MTKQDTDHDSRASAVMWLRRATVHAITNADRAALARVMRTMGLHVPRHLVDVLRYVDPVLLVDELHEWADTIERADEGKLHVRARKAAGVTRKQAAHLVASQLARRAGDPDIMPGLGDSFAIVLRDAEACRGSVWLSSTDLDGLADVYGVRPEYLSGYPLQAPNELVAKLGSKHSDKDRAKLFELARMIGGYAPSARR